MRFLLSIHDVWPGNFPQVAGYLARLRSLGARRIALLVVPAFHGRPPMDGDGEFLGWLREEGDSGTELFLHGYHHLTMESVEAGAGRMGAGRSASNGRASALTARRNAYGRWVNRRLVGQEAEFCGLPEAERDALLQLGVASWRRARLPLAGFVAPTWHGAPTVESLRAAGIGIWESRFRVARLADGRSRFVPPLAWNLSGGDDEREDHRPAGPRLFGGAVWLRGLIGLPAIKVAVHPGDLEGEGSLRVLERVFTAGTNVSYGELLSSP